MEKKIFKIKKNCRLCNSRKLKKSFDLGLNPIGDDYTKKKKQSKINSSNSDDMFKLWFQTAINSRRC